MINTFINFDTTDWYTVVCRNKRPDRTCSNAKNIWQNKPFCSILPSYLTDFVAK